MPGGTRNQFRKKMKTNEIVKIITEALNENRATRKSLAEAIVTMLEPIPNGTVIETASHKVKMCKVYCGCSQWSNREWDVTGKANGYLVDGYLIRDEDPTVWDGNNNHYRRTKLYLSPDGEGEGLKLASADRLRSLSKELPVALAEYIVGIQRDTAETKAAQEAFQAAQNEEEPSLTT